MYIILFILIQGQSSHWLGFGDSLITGRIRNLSSLNQQSTFALFHQAIMMTVLVINLDRQPAYTTGKGPVSHVRRVFRINSWWERNPYLDGDVKGRMLKLRLSERQQMELIP